MLNIRLARTGRKRDAHFRVVVSDSVHGRVGRIVETLGHYHPRMPNDAEGRLLIKADRARYWLGHGAQPSLTVKSFLKKVLAEPAPSEEDPAKEDPAKEDPSEEDPAKEDPAKEDPAKENPAKEDPAKENPAEEDQTEEDQTEGSGSGESGSGESGSNESA